MTPAYSPARAPATTIVRFPPEVTLERVRAFRALAAAALAYGYSIELDLTELVEVGALETGLLAAIVAVDKSARAVRARLRLRGVHGPVARTLEATGLDGRLEVGVPGQRPLTSI